MKSNKGQALVEFAIILPVILLLIFTIVDFGRVLSLKSDLSNIVSDSVTYYKNGKTESEINNLVNNGNVSGVKISINIRDEYTTITASKTISPITPGLTYILRKVFDVSSSRVIHNE